MEVVVRNKAKIKRNVLKFLMHKGWKHREIFVYKSRVAGTCRKDSDIDIYVQLDEKHRDLVMREGNEWSERIGIDCKKEAEEMGLNFIDYVDKFPINLDIRVGCDLDPPCPKKYEGIKYYVNLEEV